MLPFSFFPLQNRIAVICVQTGGIFFQSIDRGENLCSHWAQEVVKCAEEISLGICDFKYLSTFNLWSQHKRASAVEEGFALPVLVQAQFQSTKHRAWICSGIFIGTCKFLVCLREGQGVALPLLPHLSTRTSNWFACVNGYFRVALQLTFSFAGVLQTSLSWLELSGLVICMLSFWPLGSRR